MTTHAKTTLRQTLRARRQSLSPEQQHLAAEQLCQQLLKFLPLHSGQRIAAYLASDGEIDLQPFIQACWAADVQVFLPKVIAPSQPLTFLQYEPTSPLAPNRYGIPEPTTDQTCDTNELDWVLCPLVGFDDQGGRLGMGGGFYDRTFENKAGHTRLLGIAHQCQRVNTLPKESWDIPVEAVVTDHGVIAQ